MGTGRGGGGFSPTLDSIKEANKYCSEALKIDSIKYL